MKKGNCLVGIFENFTKSHLFFILFLLTASAGAVYSQKIIKKEVVPDGLASKPVLTADEKISDESFSAFKTRAKQTDFSPINRTDEKISQTSSPEDEFKKFLNEKKPSLSESPNHFGKDKKESSEDEDEAQIEGREKFHWKPALVESMSFLGIQHGFRLIQKKTRSEFEGPFFRDWGNSVKALRGWGDGDNFATNYLGHPLQGGVTGRIFINNSDRARQQEFGKSKEYWKSRLKAAIWSTVWSTQFEIGPIGEATIGNVGMRKKKGYSEMAYIDLVITPTVGTGVVIGEDAIDKYILKNWFERKAGRVTTKIKILRSVLTPTTAFTNLLRGKAPWRRDDR